MIKSIASEEQTLANVVMLKVTRSISKNEQNTKYPLNRLITLIKIKYL